MMLSLDATVKKTKAVESEKAPDSCNVKSKKRSKGGSKPIATAESRKARLEGARFRYLNEMLYTSHSKVRPCYTSTIAC